ncbi:MAG: hypothetical protein K2H64_00940 [Desulfovibrio sp.]|nr:hypothetical protein [Desulfovibrio sp.]
MPELKDFSLDNIDWDLSPEQAVTLYLEWGNNDWTSEFPPVRSKDDVATYFVVDSWEDPPKIRLVRRNSEEATDLFVMPLPEELKEAWKEANGDLKGVSAPPPKIKAWLKRQLGQEDLAR